MAVLSVAAAVAPESAAGVAVSKTAVSRAKGAQAELDKAGASSSQAKCTTLPGVGR